MKLNGRWVVSSLVLLVFQLVLVTLFVVYAHSGEGASLFSFEKTIVSSMQPVIEFFAGNSLMQGVGVIVTTLVVASIINWFLFKILVWGASLTKIALDDQIVILLKAPVYYSLLVSGVSYGLSLMELPESIQEVSTRCIKTVGVIIWMVFFIRLSSLILSRLALLKDKFTFIQQRTLTLFDNVAKVAIFIGAVYLIFLIWKIDMTAWLASAGIAGIAIGFAAKDTLANLFSGVFILADSPYTVGDYIVLERGDRGRVTHIGLRSTRILTRDDVEITIPNSIMGNTTIINQSGGPSQKMRLRIPVGVAFGTDGELVKKILLEIADKEPMICDNPPPSVRLQLLGASSLNFELRGWITKPELRGRATDALNNTIQTEFKKHGIEIPYAKQDLYIKGLPKTLYDNDAKDSGKQE